ASRGEPGAHAVDRGAARPARCGALRGEGRRDAPRRHELGHVLQGPPGHAGQGRRLRLCVRAPGDGRLRAAPAGGRARRRRRHRDAGADDARRGAGGRRGDRRRVGCRRASVARSGEGPLMRVVVVGATGNVGTSVVSALAADGAVESIVGLARRPRGPAHPKVRWERADVRLTDLTSAFAGADAVVHLAWLLQPSHREPHMRAVNVDGSGRVFAAAAGAGVKTLVYASSVGAYAAAPTGDRPLGESWPATGIPSAFYGRHKALVEAMLDRFEAEHPQVRVVRLRPALIFKREAATAIRRYFVGPVVPPWAIRPGALPAVPWPAGLSFQAVHSDDIGEAYRLAVTDDRARGREELGWAPNVSALDALAELLGGIPARSGGATPVLAA